MIPRTITPLSTSQRARLNFVRGCLDPSGVSDPALLRAVLETEREKFLPAAYRDSAYLDRTIYFAARRALASPLLLCRMIHALGVKPDRPVLVVGAGYGYAAALLGKMTCQVVAVEDDDTWRHLAAAPIHTPGENTVMVVAAPLIAGFAPAAPYDAILVEGGYEIMARSLVRQLGEGGRIVAVEKSPSSPIGQVRLWHKSGDNVTTRQLFDASLPVLPGFARRARFEL